MSKFIGFTTTVPIEVFFAADYIPVDLNNYFIASEDPQFMVDFAEQEGFPRNCCSWIKGIYTSALMIKLSSIIGVMSGDCNQSQILCQALEDKGIKIIPFFYPYNQNIPFFIDQLERLRRELGASRERIVEAKAYLDRIRKKAALIDEATWKRNLVHGVENHLFLVSCSDMKSDPDAFEKEIEDFLVKINDRDPLNENVRLGFIGVPPIFTDFYDFCESVGARVVFNEVQRQFSMPYGCTDMKEQYLRFTYPYSLRGRLADIKMQIRDRDLDGLIHYCQSFCFRNMEDLIFRRHLSVPVLSIEGDCPGGMDARTRIRIESFIEMLAERKGTER